MLTGPNTGISVNSRLSAEWISPSAQGQLSTDKIIFTQSRLLTLDENIIVADTVASLHLSTEDASTFTLFGHIW